MIRLFAGWLLVNSVLMAPQWVHAATPDGPLPAWIAVDAALIVGGMALLPERPWSRALAWVVAATTVVVTLLGLANIVFLVTLARPINLFVDLYLLRAVYDLAVGNAGVARTAAVFLLVVTVCGLATYALVRLLQPALREGQRSSAGPSARTGAWVLAVAFGLGLIGEAAPRTQDRLAIPTFELAREQNAFLWSTRQERRDFAAELSSAPASYRGIPGLLSGLRDTDVLLAFLESYGMAALDDPEFAALVLPRLDSLAMRMSRAGIHMATATFMSPTQGGQSWYAHGTVLSGLWLENQLRYDLLLASDRETLVDDFREAGHRTVAVMPAITRGWPEGARLGYDEIYTLPDIPYAGPPIYWVSMPDQFTWSFLSRLAGQDVPLFAEVAMVSSHAPWTPILPMLDWDSIGDGSAFEPFRQDGHPPEYLWVDIAALRRGYARSLAYSVEAMTGFAERFIDAETLLLAIGDHQAAPWVTGAASSAVPVHVISGDPKLIEPFLEWGFRPGALPDPDREPIAMDEIRPWLVRAFSDVGSGSDPRAAEGGG